MVVATCIGYLSASSLLILLNKFLLSQDGFAFPLMLSGSGMFVTCVGSSIIVKIPAIVPERQVPFAPMIWSHVFQPHWRKTHDMRDCSLTYASCVCMPDMHLCVYMVIGKLPGSTFNPRNRQTLHASHR